ncbi:MAG: glycosyltransferase family 4 protein [Thaumarchaeota archaeon]|nr:glycosyltransferase family 4 protein [Nitrososphaerota archaeon]
MRILILNWRDIKNPTAGGAELAVDNIARQLSKFGHKITIFTSAYNGCKREEKTNYAKIIRKGSMTTVYLHAFSYYLSHSNDFDAIIESVSTVPFFTPLYARNKKIVIIPHQVTGKTVFKEVPFTTAVMVHTAENFIPLVYRNTNFIVPSKSVKSDFEELGIDPKLVTASYFNTVSPNFRKVRVKEYKKPTLITVTRLVTYKRVDILIDILAELSKKIDVQLIIVGTGKEMGNLKGQAKRLDVSDRIWFTGHVNEKKKAELLSKSWVFVTASEKEGFGISALEAQKCGTPVVTFNNGGLKEAVKHNYSGLVIKEADRKAFENAIISLLMNDKLRNKLSANSIAYGNSFNTQKEIRKIENMISR